MFGGDEHVGSANKTCLSVTANASPVIFTITSSNDSLRRGSVYQDCCLGSANQRRSPESMRRLGCSIRQFERLVTRYSAAQFRQSMLGQCIPRSRKSCERFALRPNSSLVGFIAGAMNPTTVNLGLAREDSIVEATRSLSIGIENCDRVVEPRTKCCLQLGMMRVILELRWILSHLIHSVNYVVDKQLGDF